MSEGNINSSYIHLLSVDDFSGFSPEELLSYLAQLIDLSFDLAKIEGINKALTLINSIDKGRMSSEQKAILYYYSANAWGNKYAIEHPGVSDNYRWEWKQEELENAIFLLRSSINEEGFNNLDSSAKCNIYTNLGNAFDTAGRYIEALEYWRRSLEIDPDFGMALGNTGVGLENASHLLYDAGHQGLYIREARNKLASAIKALLGKEQYNFALRSFERTLERIEKRLGDSKDHTCLTKQFSLGKSEEEQKFRKWCLRHRLFLNPLNDLGDYSIAAQDIITTPDMVTAIDVGPRYQGFYNQMKQEFVSARYLFYEGITEKRPHFSDRCVLLHNTLDYPSYSLSIEKVKIAFRIAYSLLDKIAYFINEYFAFGKNPKQIYFKTIWFKDNERKDFLPVLKAKRNLPLRGLFWLSKDIFDEETGFRGSVEPDSQNLYEIRNHLEHKYLKVHDMLIPGSDDPIYSNLKDDLAYSIDRKNYEQKTLRLLRLVRNALIYLSLAIHSEEVERSRKRGPNEIIMPMITDLWEDEWKI